MKSYEGQMDHEICTSLLIVLDKQINEIQKVGTVLGLNHIGQRGKCLSWYYRTKAEQALHYARVIYRKDEVYVALYIVQT